MSWSSPFTHELSRGTVIENRYVLVRAIGKGATSVLFEARSLSPALADHGQETVALKVLRRALGDDDDAVASFTQEAFLTSRLDHENLVRALDFGELPDGRPYSAVELCQGLSFHDLIREYAPMSPASVAHLMDGCAAGLQALHERGIIHRDVKPANLFLETRPGGKPRVRVLDLGIAAVYDRKLASTMGPLASPIGRQGTPGYIAPEQVLGERVLPAADVYGLACVAYRLLTNRDPFRRGSPSETIRAHLLERPPRPSRVNPALPEQIDAVFARALTRDPRKRTGSAVAFASELRCASAFVVEERDDLLRWTTAAAASAAA